MPEVLCHEYVCICLRSQIKSFLAVISYYRPIFCCVLVNWYMLQSNHSFRHLIFHLGRYNRQKKIIFVPTDLESVWKKFTFSSSDRTTYANLLKLLQQKIISNQEQDTRRRPLQKRAQKDLALQQYKKNDVMLSNNSSKNLLHMESNNAKMINKENSREIILAKVNLENI